jgi:hypothetical protein
LTLVAIDPPQQTDSSQWLMIIFFTGLFLVLFISIVLKQNVINPRKAKYLALMEKKTQVLDDVANIRAIMVIQKMSGVLLFNEIVNTKEKLEEMLFSGFVHAITLFSANMTNGPNNVKNIGNGDLTSSKKFETLEFIHENFNILVIDGTFTRVAAILDNPASDLMKSNIKRFIVRFEDTFDSILKSWDNNTVTFAETGSKIAQNIFSLEFNQNYMINNDKTNDEIRNFIHPNSISSTVYNIMNTLTKEQGGFKISIVKSLISDSNQLEAKNLIMDLIAAKIIVPVGEAKEKEIAIVEAIQDLNFV